MSTERFAYRLRNPTTGEFLLSIRERQAVFTSDGKTYKHKHQAVSIRSDYNLLRAIDFKPWPELELVTYKLVIDSVEADPTPNLDHLAKFINETQGGSHWGPVAKEAKRLVMRGDDFTYLIHTHGQHDLRAIKTVHINHIVNRSGWAGEPKDQMVVALPDNDTDLIYAKMAMGHEIQGIWNFKTCQKI